MSSTEEKIRSIIREYGADPRYLEAIEKGLEDIGYRTLRQVEMHPIQPPKGLTLATVPDEQKRNFVILDAETEGLDYRTDKIIQLAMIRGTCCRDGILSIDAHFDQRQDPGRPLDPEITRLTGFTDADLAGRAIDTNALTEFIEGVDIMIAFKSSFDRPFVEAMFPDVGFKDARWACALSGVDWKRNMNVSSSSLENICFHLGMTYNAHRADSDILATAHALNATPGESDRTAFREMIDNAMTGTVRLIGTVITFDEKEAAKINGYKWDGEGDQTGQRAWFKDIPYRMDACVEEAAFLRRLKGRDVTIEAIHHDPKTMFSNRAGRKLEFHTGDFPEPDPAVADKVAQSGRDDATPAP